MSTVDTHHEDYIEYKDQWALCRDLSEGQCAIHKAGEKYLPRLKDETDHANFITKDTFNSVVTRLNYISNRVDAIYSILIK